jgi:hypothetical protein
MEHGSVVGVGSLLQSSALDQRRQRRARQKEPAEQLSIWRVIRFVRGTLNFERGHDGRSGGDSKQSLEQTVITADCPGGTPVGYKKGWSRFLADVRTRVWPIGAKNRPLLAPLAFTLRLAAIEQFFVFLIANMMALAGWLILIIIGRHRWVAEDIVRATYETYRSVSDALPAGSLLGSFFGSIWMVLEGFHHRVNQWSHWKSYDVYMAVSLSAAVG